MTDSEGEPKGSRWSEIFALLDDQLKLASLELRYEKALALRRVLAYGMVVLLVATAFVLLQVALVCALLRVGLALGGACLGLGCVYVAGAWGVFRVWARRDPRVGKPFQASAEELKENLRWIRKFFS